MARQPLLVLTALLVTMALLVTSCAAPPGSPGRGHRHAGSGSN